MGERRKQKMRQIEAHVYEQECKIARLQREMGNLKYNTLQYVLLVLGQVQEDRDKRGEGG